ncbi:capsule assembly Wzi family protein [Roseivirga sp. 4D4]|uniref:capsule assembly Wzi family protein n=1 Tax=Roseivirga sp. 4D4 TaxID=1889784 RepID=UPI001481414C|nr:capsule assembly Wzi family protein [Roseivirga sp. 4D4]
MNTKLLCALFLLTIASFSAYAQSFPNKDSLNVKFAIGTATSTEPSFLPFYLVNDRYGLVDEGDNVFVRGNLQYQKDILDQVDFTTGFSFRNDLLNTYFLRLDHKWLYLRIGSQKEQRGGLEESLSSGSMGISRNARPIPMISIGIDEYVDVPFTNGYFKTKGHLDHGWFESDRYISNALLHSKSFYLKLDLEDEIGWTAASGVVHFAQYGGISPQGDQQPSSFSDFLRVFLGSGIPNPDGTTAGESNGLGNHLGIIETTVTHRLGDHKLTINYQKPFEDLGGLQYVSLTDYLFGLEWSLPKKESPVNTIYLEYIQTKWQGGPGLPDPTNEVPTETENFGYSFGGRDDMYNNWLYRSGWTYGGQVIGNPLFLTHERVQEFLGSFPDYTVSIASNRLRAVHLGFRGKVSSKLGYEGLFTYTQNFGTYAGLYEGRFEWDGIINDTSFDYVFRPMREQFYSQVKLVYENVFDDMPIHLGIRLAYDFGDLYNLFGSEISFVYNLTK